MKDWLRTFALGLLIGLMVGFVPASADTGTSTATSSNPNQAQIDQTQAQITELEQEIAQLQSELTATTEQKQTLQTAVNALNLQIQTLTKSISLTNAQIKQTDRQIGTLSGNITTTQGQIGDSQSGVAESLRDLQVADQEPLFLSLLGGGTLSTFFTNAVALQNVRDQLENKIAELSNLKTNLQTSKNAAQNKRTQLATLESNLSQQKKGLTIAEQSQSQLLDETKGKESNYQALIAQKKAQEAQFEEDLLNFEKGLGLKVLAGSLPPVGAEELAWPLTSVRITQYFGNTPFATANSQIYSGHGHTGIDLAAAPGTPVLAARDGIVLGTGNTDLTCPNASFGKWIFIKHDDGLSTLYAHLASFAVSEGDSVTQGQVIGYSDTTGYATGPHLHFGVYASSGSEIASFASQSCRGKTYTMPVGDLSAYLNPLSYLPAVPH